MADENYKELFPELLSKLVLNVDDNEMNQLVLSQILRNAGIKVESALNGEEAIDILKSGLKPDFILLDLEMPKMNGIDTAYFIKKNIDAKIPIIINTGYAAAHEKWRLNRLGINEYLEKPYKMIDIFSKLSHHVHSDVTH